MSLTGLLVSTLLVATPSGAGDAASTPDAPASAQSGPASAGSTVQSPELLPPPTDVEGGIRAAYQNAQNQQGSLDGRWRLADADGTPLFAFVMADSGGQPSPRAASPYSPAVEGAWRDLRRPSGPASSGFLAGVDRTDDGARISFRETGAAKVTVVKLRADANGVWSGDLIEDGVSRPVIMRRF